MPSMKKALELVPVFILNRRGILTVALGHI
jgi:hypothetical protein